MQICPSRKRLWRCQRRLLEFIARHIYLIFSVRVNGSLQETGQCEDFDETEDDTNVQKRLRGHTVTVCDRARLPSKWIDKWSQLFKASIAILWNSLGNKRETKDNFRTFFPTFKDLLWRMKLSLITIIKRGFLFKYNPLTLPITWKGLFIGCWADRSKYQYYRYQQWYWDQYFSGSSSSKFSRLSPISSKNRHVLANTAPFPSFMAYRASPPPLFCSAVVPSCDSAAISAAVRETHVLHTTDVITDHRRDKATQSFLLQ